MAQAPTPEEQFLADLMAASSAENYDSLMEGRAPDWAPMGPPQPVNMAPEASRGVALSIGEPDVHPFTMETMEDEPVFGVEIGEPRLQPPAVAPNQMMDPALWGGAGGPQLTGPALSEGPTRGWADLMAGGQGDTEEDAILKLLMGRR